MALPQSKMAMQVTVRIFPRTLHRALIGLAVARQRAKLVSIGQPSVATFSRWSVITFRVTPRQRHAYGGRLHLQGLRLLLDVAKCPVDDVSICFCS